MQQTFLTNNQIKLGDIAPDFKAVNKNVEDVNLSDIKTKRKVILTVPSLDTDVCDVQAKTFSKRLGLMDDLELIVISLDLPFAQNRWCGANDITNITMLSDYKYHDFSEKYGLKLDTLALLGRSVIILDENNKVTYIEICKNVPDHPDYEKAFNALNI